ncbi:chromogranin-A isoform X1 [Cyanistes caeruleus]|uniref:chromogranin-A isoform X1 n=1 Tax=Cyanistes caeruleus TaxID=156563 RepID=UPI000CDB4063|nr:chromogranin-A isoform X1 [Cyanistes caeruleus]
MSRPELLAVLLLAVPAVSLPVTNDMNKGDTKVMKCIVEVISDTLSKPNPLPISEECLETLRGDERIISILRHQNLLKELQEIAAQGANERTQQQKKNSGFEDELSEVLESQNDKNKQRGQCQPPPPGNPGAAGERPEEEQPTGSLAELAAQKPQQNEDSREEGKNSLEEREPRPRDIDPVEKEDQEEAESNYIRDSEDTHRNKVLDNHIGKNFSEDEQHQQGDEEEEPRGSRDSLELEDEGEEPSRQGQEHSKEVAGEHVEQEDDGDEAAEEDPTEAERSLDLAEEDEEAEEMQRGDNNDDELGFGKDVRSSEEEEEEEEEEQPRALRGGRHRLENEEMQGEEDTFQPRDAKSDEMEEESSREWEDTKRWNKMDELAKQLTSKKRMEENDSEEDPDRSMKKTFRSRKYAFSSPEEDVRRSWKRHSKEDSSEGGFPLAPMPEEKKDEEGSANRRTEDQELESLAAIEAELERVAHKLHELRRG